ncbi:MAG TPA: serine/threonine-protein kinase, partial [Polyangiales bacterium]|nr:serine/threonine-protein kinase [Polyangiales bacterium]
MRLLGEGSFGRVFEAKNQASGRQVAIKALHPQWTADREASGRLLQEAHASARVRHRNVIDVYDVDREDDVVFLVMEYLHGEPLTAALARGTLPMHGIVSLLVHAMRGIAALHRHGIVHRDIKPENIFLAREDDEPDFVPKILDFGISKLEVQGAAPRVSTSFGRIMGSPLYMSCEQIENSKLVDHRTDVYACGVVLYEALTGRAPFESESLTGLIGQVLYTNPPPPRQLRPDIPGPLDRAIQRAMAKHPNDRTQSIERLIRDCEPFATERGFERRAPGQRPAGQGQASGKPPMRGQPSRSRHAVVPKRPDTSPTAVVRGRVPRRFFGALFFAFMLLAVWSMWSRNAAERRAKDATAIIMAQTRADPEKQAVLLREVRDKRTPGWSQAAWMAVTSAVPNRKLVGHDSAVRSVAFSRDGKVLLTRSDDNTARVWRTDGSTPPIVLHVAPHELRAAALSPDGRYVLTGSSDSTARVWTVDSSAEPRFLNGHQAAVVVVAFSPDGRKVATGSDDTTARIWNTSGAGESIVLRGQGAPLRALAYAPDGRHLATGAEDGSVRVWSADGTGEPLVLPGHTGPVITLAFSPNSRRLLSTSADKTLRVWSIEGPDAPIVLRGHSGRVLTAAFSPDGKLIASGSDDDTARV